MTIGGGSNVVVTQNGTFTVAVGETGAAKTLPLTGVTVAGKCELVTAPPAPSEGGLARILSASSGTMDAIASSGTGGQVGTFGGTTLTTGPAAVTWRRRVQRHREWGWIGESVTANGATATITFGTHVDTTTKSCAYLWQATEAPN